MKEPTPWRCIHNKCGKIAYYVSHVNWWDDEKKFGTTASDPTQLPECVVVSFDGTAYRIYPDGERPERKECKCFSCGELIPMYPEKGVLELEWDEPDWYAYFCDVLKKSGWSAADAIHVIRSVKNRRQFADMPEELKEKYQAVEKVGQVMEQYANIFNHETYIEHDERKRK